MMIMLIYDDYRYTKEYIVYMGSLPARAEYIPMSHHMSILQEVVGERCDFIYSFSDHYIKIMRILTMACVITLV